MQIETSFASQLYESARRLTPTEGSDPASGPAGGAPDGITGTSGAAFSEALAAAAGEMAESLRAGEVASRQALTGAGPGASRGDVQSVVEALTSAEMALQTAVAVRDRVVEAYQEVLRMPI